MEEFLVFVFYQILFYYLEKDKKLLKDENTKLERRIQELFEEKSIILMEKEVQKGVFQKSLQESESIIIEKPITRSVATWTVKHCSEAATNTEKDTETNTGCEKDSAVDEVLNDRLVRLESLLFQGSNDKQVVGYPVNQYSPQVQYPGQLHPHMYNPPPTSLHPPPPSHPPHPHSPHPHPHPSQIMYTQPYFPQPCFY